MADVSVQWTGWCRRRKGSGWFKVCTAAAIGECARLLDAEGRRRGIPDRHQVLVFGDHPPRPDGRLDGRHLPDGEEGRS
jgi:hypothetical protein